METEFKKQEKKQIKQMKKWTKQIKQEKNSTNKQVKENLGQHEWRTNESKPKANQSKAE